jgi:hypothetical protein
MDLSQDSEYLFCLNQLAYTATWPYNNLELALFRLSRQMLYSDQARNNTGAI